MTTSIERRLRMIEGGASNFQSHCDAETQRALTKLTDEELPALGRAYVEGVTPEVVAIVARLEGLKAEARAAK